MVKVVLFDLGNTLLYFDGIWSEMIVQADQALIEALNSSGYILGENFPRDFDERMDHYYQERQTEFLEYTSRMLLLDLLNEQGYNQVPLEHIDLALKKMYAVSQAHWVAENDALPLLKSLRESGYRIGLISNANDDQDVQTLIDKGQIRPFLDLILVSAAVGIRKPNPKIFQMALDHFGVTAQEAVMVGDTLGADILGANHLGIPSVWINRRALNRPDNLAHEDTILPTAVISKLDEIPDLLKVLENRTH
jgi:5'-nucleotidase